MRIKKSKVISALFSPLYLFLDWKIGKKNIDFKREKRILIVFLGYIGDYILFRNFIQEIKNDAKYKDHTITFCADPLWKDLAENMEKKNIKKFIWVDRKKFLINLKYRLEKLKEVQKESFDVALSPNYGRTFSIDSLIRVAYSKQKIGNKGCLENIFWWQKRISDCYYDQLIIPGNETDFEFMKNKKFFQKFLKKNLSTQLTLPFKKRKIEEQYVVFVPGAGAKFREWNSKNFAKLADTLIQEKKTLIKILGSKKDKETAQEIIKSAQFHSRIENLAGEIKLSDSVDLLGNARVVISNDTGPFHMAVATNVPTLCISNGNSFGKFHPYPPEMKRKIEYAYPVILEKMSFNRCVEEYARGSTLDINGVSVDEVIEKVNSLFSEK